MSASFIISYSPTHSPICMSTHIHKHKQTHTHTHTHTVHIHICGDTHTLCSHTGVTHTQTQFYIDFFGSLYPTSLTKLSHLLCCTVLCTLYKVAFTQSRTYIHTHTHTYTHTYTHTHTHTQKQKHAREEYIPTFLKTASVTSIFFTAPGRNLFTSLSRKRRNRCKIWS